MTPEELEQLQNLEMRLIELEAKVRGDWRPRQGPAAHMFADQRERYLRREILDEFISGKDVDIAELRAAVAAFVNRYCEQADGYAMIQQQLAMIQKQLEQCRRSRTVPPFIQPRRPPYR